MRRTGWRWIVGSAVVAGCGGEAPPGPAPAVGEPLAVTAPATPAAGTCADCGRPAGAQHRCGASRLCPACKRDAAPAGHVCHVSRFCKTCGLEAAIAGHRCGETRFDASVNADVERTDLGGEDDE